MQKDKILKTETKIIPVGDRVLVLPETVSQVGKIFIPDSVKQNPVIGEVIATGGGLAKPLTVKKGDIVLYGRFAGIPFDDTVLMMESEIFAIILTRKPCTLQLLQNRVLVRREEIPAPGIEKKTLGGILILEPQDKFEVPGIGIVVGKGPGLENKEAHGNMDEIGIGDKIYYSKFAAGLPIEVDGEEIGKMMRATDILCKY